jgi:hypothetical protein
LKIQEYSPRPVQIVYLTAMLPPTKQSRFFELIDLDGEAVSIHRDVTTRVNFAYSVVEWDRKDEKARVRTFVE